MMIAGLATPAGRGLTPDDIVRGIKHLPSPPKILPRLKRLLCDGNSAMPDIVELIRLDQGIAASVLRMSNSAYFSRGARCVTVDEAVSRLGYDQVYELVSFAVASQVLERPLRVYGIEANDLWAMSVAGALSAERLAEAAGLDRSVAYTVGLLHGVGMVAIDAWALRQRPTLVLASAGFPLEATQSEQAELGFTQAAVGGALLRHWGFPDAIVGPVAAQYVPNTPMAGLLQAARWMRDAAIGRTPMPSESGSTQPGGFDLDVLNPLAEEVAGRLATMLAEMSAPVASLNVGGHGRTRVPSTGEIG